MTVSTPPDMALAVRRAAVRATLAPSVHNTQPWRFVLGPRSLEVHADRSRRLDVLDPTGRQLLISCGCAVFNARASFAASGLVTRVERAPDPMADGPIVRLDVAPATDGDRPCTPDRLGALDAVVEVRRTNRRRFAEDPVPDDVVDLLVDAAHDEGSVLAPVRGTDDQVAVAVLSQRADRLQNADPAYRAELRAWTTDDPSRDDGVPAAAVPHAGQRDDEVPIRDFDTSGHGALPAQTHSSSTQCLLLLGTAADDPASWVRAGEALERVLLEVTRHGFVASPMTQVVEVATAREMLRRDLRLHMHPHVLLRVGRAPATPAPRRRRLVDMLDGPA